MPGEGGKRMIIKLFKITTTNAYQMVEQGEGYSLSPWSGDNKDYQGYDDGGRDYTLPEGYGVAESREGECRIYNARGEYCLLGKKSNNPCLITSDGEIILKEYFQVISQSQAASTLGKLGGSAKSEAKSTASRANGKLGGRPRKAKEE